MGNVVKIALIDESGKPLAGIAVAITGSANKLNTNASGLVQFLLDEGPFDLSINGKSVLQTSTQDVSGVIQFKRQADQSFSKV